MSRGFELAYQGISICVTIAISGYKPERAGAILAMLIDLYSWPCWVQETDRIVLWDSTMTVMIPGAGMVEEIAEQVWKVNEGYCQVCKTLPRHGAAGKQLASPCKRFTEQDFYALICRTLAE